MIAPVPKSGSGENQPLLGNNNKQYDDLKDKSFLYRARRSPFTVACVVAMALFTDMVVYGVVVPVLPDIIKRRLGGTSSDVGLLFACYAIGLLASTPIFAILSDKYQNRRIPMMVGMLGLAVATVGFSLATNYWVLLIARIGQGSAGGASWTIGLGMLADVYPPDNLGVVMGACMMANAVGFMVGPMVGGYLYEFYGLEAPFLFCAALAVIDFVCILFIAEPEKKDFASSTSTIQLDVDSLAIGDGQDLLTGSNTHPNSVKNVDNSRPSYGSSSSSSSSSTSSDTDSTNTSEDGTDVSMFTIASNWTITCCLLSTFVAASVFSGLEPILPLYLEELLGASPSQTGVIILAAVFPTLFASGIGYYADRIGHFYVSLIGMLLFAIGTFSLALPTTYLSFIIPLAIFGLGSSTILTPLLPAMADVANKKGWNCYAKTYALYNMTYSLSMAAGPILAGYIFEDFGFRWTMVMFGFMIVAATPVIFSSQIAVIFARFRSAHSTTASNA